jgi:hypothetical protein
MEVTDTLHGPRDFNLRRVLLEDQGRDGKPSLKEKTFLENNEKGQKKTVKIHTRILEPHISWGSVSFSV